MTIIQGSISRSSLFLFLAFFTITFSYVQAQQAVSGTVTGTDGQPLLGVSVIIQGTSNGTVTDFDGKYLITVPSDDAVLLFSFLGFQTTEVSVDGRDTLDVILEEGVAELSEVVLIGYGSTTKGDLTDAITSVKAEEFNKGVTVSPQQLLQGKAAGVNITQNSGQPGANVNVRIRGSGSVTQTNEPLYVIDGVPVSFREGGFAGQNSGQDRTQRAQNNPLNMLNSSDIESIDVLKDASATAIYGVRASNGVVLITTKSGKKGNMRVDYDTYLSVGRVRRTLDVLDADQLRAYAAERNLDFPIRTDFQDPELAAGDGGSNTDWQDEVFRTSFSQSHNIAFSGGNQTSDFRASIGLQDQEGILISSGLKTVTSRLNIGSRFLEDKLKMRINVINSDEISDNVPIVGSVGGGAGGDILRDALRANPTVPVRDANGDFTYVQLNVQNPVEEATFIEDITENKRLLGNLNLDFQFSPSLTFTTTLGYTRENISKKSFIPIGSRLGQETGGLGQIQKFENENQLLEAYFNYDTSLFNTHNLKVLAGFSYQKFENEGNYIRRQGFVEDIIGFDGIDAGANIQIASSFANENDLESVYGRFIYEIADKYLVKGSLRYDGASVLGAENKRELFPSIAVAWKMSEEPFLKESNVISDLKLRVGYGEVGNARIGPNRSLRLIGLTTNVNPELGLFARPETNPNPNLQFETSEQTNIGLDYGLFGGTLTGSINYYNKRTADLLLSFNSPSNFVGVRNFLANVGEVENKGFEFDFNLRAVSSKNFSLDFYGNFATNENTIISLSNDTFQTPDEGIPQVDAPSAEQNGFIIRQKAGRPINSFFMLDFIGFDQNGEEQFRDVDGDGQITPDDRIFVGDANPDLTYGFGLNLGYKRFNFDMFLRGIQGIEIYNGTRNDIEDPDLLPNVNALDAVLLEGQARGPIGEASSRFLEDGSYLRMENATLSYDLNVDKIPFINSLNLYVTGQNLFVLTEYTGYDPEINRVDYTTFPRPTNYIFGLRAQF